MPVESDIQRTIIGYLRGLDDTYVLNIGGSASTAKGTPDLVVCHRGRFVALEIKRPDGSYGLTKAQEIRMRQITKAGGVAAVVTSIDDVKVTLAYLQWSIDTEFSVLYGGNEYPPPKETTGILGLITTGRK